MTFCNYLGERAAENVRRAVDVVPGVGQEPRLRRRQRLRRQNVAVLQQVHRFHALKRQSHILLFLYILEALNHANYRV